MENHNVYIMGKSIISMVIFNSYVNVYQRVCNILEMITIHERRIPFSTNQFIKGRHRAVTGSRGLHVATAGWSPGTNKLLGLEIWPPLIFISNLDSPHWGAPNKKLWFLVTTLLVGNGIQSYEWQKWWHQDVHVGLRDQRSFDDQRFSSSWAWGQQRSGGS